MVERVFRAARAFSAPATALGGPGAWSPAASGVEGDVNIDTPEPGELTEKAVMRSPGPGASAHGIRR